MKISSILKILAIGSALLLSVGCSQKVAANLALKVQGTAPSAKARALTGFSCGDGSIAVDSAYLSISEIEFELKGNVDSATEVEDAEFKGPYFVDLLTNKVSPELGLTDLPAGEYDDIEFEIDKIDDEDIKLGVMYDKTHPLAVGGYSILVKGAYTPSAAGAAAIPFTFGYTDDVEVQIAAPANGAIKSFTIDENAVNNIIIAFRMSEWFDKVNLAGAIAKDDKGADAIVIDGNNKSNTDAVKAILEQLEDKIEQSADYGKDNDGNGALSEAEDQDD